MELTRSLVCLLATLDPFLCIYSTHLVNRFRQTNHILLRFQDNKWLNFEDMHIYIIKCTRKHHDYKFQEYSQ